MSKLIQEAGVLLLSKDTGKTLRNIREKHGVSGKELADQLNISPSVISDYETGRRPSPGVAFLNRYLLGIHQASK